MHMACLDTRFSMRSYSFIIFFMRDVTFEYTRFLFQYTCSSNLFSNKKIEAAGFKTEHSLSYGIKELIKGFQIIKKSGYGNI